MAFEISAAFAQARVRLSWREVEFGLQEGWLTGDAVINIAIDHVTAGDESADVLALAALLPNEHYDVPVILCRLSARDANFSKGKWLYLLLAWIYENRDTINDPLAVVEEVYADFDYPEEIEGFVRYMPPRDASRVGISVLMENWRRYLTVAGRKYAPVASKD